jgi:hypothetical protein
MTSGETWFHYFILESKQSSMEWRFKGFPLPKKFKTLLLARKVTTNVFLDSERVILLGFLSQGINEQQYSNVFLSVQ